MQAERNSTLRERVERGIYKRTTRDGQTRYEISFVDQDGRQRWRTVGRLQEARVLRGELIALRLRSRFSRDDEPVFASRLGGPLGHRNVTRRGFEPARDRA